MTLAAPPTRSTHDPLDGLLRFHRRVELLPVLEKRIPDGATREAFRRLRLQWIGDHREIERVWRTLRRPLEAIGEALPRTLPVDGIRYFRALCSTHISAEESARQPRAS